MNSGAAASAPPAPRPLTRGEAAHTLAASFLGWTLDAFDFFILVFVLPTIAKEFHRSIADIAFTITATLAMRPVGAVLFGWMADRYGRRVPLMIDIVFYSIVEVASGFAPNFTVFLILRALYGIGMGGEWGVGASLAMEAVGSRSRGFFSGLLQEGYAVGYLLAAGAFFFVFPHFGWRAMFFVGGLPALLTLYIRGKVPESEAWERVRPGRGEIIGAIRRDFKPFLYLIALMTVMNFVSHGTQDLYPTFLQKARGLDPRTVATIAIVYNVGAILGGLFFGYWSDRIGRRYTMAAAVSMAGLAIPLWIIPHSLVWLAVGAFLMQFMVQGAWGVVPAHLAEMSAPEARGLFSGVAYQLGVLFASYAAFGEALIAEKFGYQAALGGVAAIVMIAAAVVILLGRERMGADLYGR
ncbi:MAG TPA: MFS transporter [Candidatus Binataceae bacterium]|nr:MFS transporter [Candidatus Binataceae bacterium]